MKGRIKRKRRKEKERKERNEKIMEAEGIFGSRKEEWSIKVKVSYIIPWVTMIYFTYVLTYHIYFIQVMFYKLY